MLPERKHEEGPIFRNNRRRGGKGARNQVARRPLRELIREADMSNHHTHLNARRWVQVWRRVFGCDGWRQPSQRKRLKLRGRFDGRGLAY